MARLFFALWPDRAARVSLATRAAEIARHSAGRPVPAANLHLTLVFLGEVESSMVGILEGAAGGLLARAFTVELDVMGGFRGARVAWAGCRQPPQAMLGLQSALLEVVRRAGFAADERPFAPHLTLARRVGEAVAVQAMDPVSWRANSFALVESGTGDGAYRNVAEWELVEEKN
jgi:RNA 2',3'-cyclic 3'-phosphodiesterase